jgi:hypothetical protein
MRFRLCSPLWPDRDQLGLDLTAALDRQADRIVVAASGHLSGAFLCGSNVIEACD